MKNLRIWHKLALLGIILLVPFAVVTYELAQMTNTISIGPAREELAGLSFDNDLRGLLWALRGHRASTMAALNSDHTLTVNADDLTAAISKVDAGEKVWSTFCQTNGGDVASDKSPDAWEGLKAQCLAIVNARPADAASAFDQHNAAIDKLLTFERGIGDTSTLILDPDLDSYYLMDFEIVQSPQLGEQISRMRALGLSAAARHKLLPGERAQLQDALAKSRYLLGTAEMSIAHASDAANDSKTPFPDMVGTLQTTAHAAVSQLWDQVDHILANESAPGSMESLNGVATQSNVAVTDLQNKLSPLLKDLLDRRIAKNNGEVEYTIYKAIIGLLLVCAVAIWGVRQITRDLYRLMAAADKIAVGELDVALPEGNRRDELGVLSQAFAHMVEALRTTADVASQIAEGDLRADVKPHSERDVLGSAFAVMLENLRRVISELGQAAGLMGAAVSEISASTSQLAASSTETAAAVSETTTTVEEVRQTAHLSNDKARLVASSAQRAAEVAQNGRLATDDALAGMHRIKQQMEAIADSMVHLSGQSQAIGDIIASVDDLAQQSNLLAVNASIEAAKAGDQGKGFAVVAQEVKSLAEQSRQATMQVRALLNDTQKATGEAVLAAEQGNKAVDTGAVQSAEAGDAIATLNSSVADAAEAATQIAASSQQQLVGMDQVAVAMESIKQASSQNVDSAQQMEMAAQRLNQLGFGLKELVDQFKF